MMTHDPPSLTQAEAAKRLGVSRWTVRRMLNNGRLRGVWIGSRTRIPGSEVERLLRAREETP